MIRLCALNDDSSEESDHEPTQESVKQAKESEALELYNKGLALQQKGDYEQAEEAYNHLLNSALVKEAPPPEEEAGLVELSQVLKYSAYKNLASLAEKRDQWEKSIDAYLQAVALDDSDVTVWYHLGVVAMKAYDLCLARHSFEEGLKCNPKHWPCLDLLCTVLYSIADYYTCLVMISKALERDEDYVKGMALKNQIFSEEPALKRDSQHLRNLFVSSFVSGEETKVEMAEFVKEAVRLREERLKLIEADRAPPPPLTPVKPLTSHTWASLGECFIALYDHLTTPENPQPLGRRVDLEGYYKAIVTPDISMSYRASVIKVPDYSSSSFSTEGFTVYKSGQSGEGEDKNKKGTKRKKPPAASVESDFLPKRRSARVRTNKKKEEEVNYRELILSFIPTVSRPCVSVDDESSQDSLADGIQFSQRGSQSQIADGKPGEGFSSDDRNRYDEVISGEAETLDILTFVKEQMENGGIIDLMNQYGICLAAQNNKKWPFALADVFLKVYQRMRKHVILPSEFCCDQDELYRTRMAKLILVANELTLDKLLTAKSKSSSSLSPASSPRGGSTVVSPLRGSGFSSQYLATDMEYLHRISSDRTIHGDFTLEMATRVNWMKARYLMLQGQMDFAMVFLDRSSKLLTLKVNSIEGPTTIKLVNCKVDNIITLDQVQKKLESLQRCQSLEEVHRLYESGLYEDVVQLLMPTLYQPQPKTKASELGMSIPERPAQLLLLQDSLIKLKEYEKCLTCSEVALNEAVSQMSPCEAWSTTLARLFACIDRSILESKTVLSKIPQEKLNRLTQNIIKVLEASMYAVENSSEPPLATAKPWVLLYRIIKHQEKDDGSWDKTTKTYPSTAAPPTDSPMTETASTDSNLDSVSVSSDMPNVSPSLQFLRIAHENLGRRGWCCNNDGVFLLLKVNVLIEELTKPVLPAREDLVRDLEQCFLCLYGHPSKKAKTRGLQEHSSSQIALTWSNSAVVFDYFKPPEPPTFDSKSNTISAEVQNLLRRITIVIPQHELEDISFESVQAFIEGGDEPVPKLPDRLVGVKRPVIGEIFYLLADFFFKNKEFSKALKFYMHDVCVQPDRADTWAAMALARKSRLENKLNACEPKSEGPIQKLAVSALRCFKRALEIDGSNSSLWEEYGSLCYVLYSHSSRQLNQFDKDEMSPDSRQSLVQRRDDMLLLSESCFTSALGIEDAEPWLHHYILGKILEKLKKPPGVYLEHYQKSAKYLDDDISSYPRRISYYSPPEHSLEALEIYFRIHVSIIKLLFDKFPDVDVTVLEEHLQRASQGPFYQPEFDADTGQGIIYRSESTTSESLSVSAFEETKQNETKSKVTTSGEESTSRAEKPLKDECDLTKANDILAEEPKDVAMETSSREVEGHFSTASSLQSEESSAPTPMEVEQSAPSSSVTSPEPANDGAHVVASLEQGKDGEQMQTDRRKTLETSQCLPGTIAQESLPVSAFEETEQNQTKSKDTTTGEESTTEKPLKEESDLTEAKDIIAEEPQDVAMETPSREVEGHFSTASSLQSEESSIRTPMEVEQSAPSSGVTSPEQAQDGAQTPLSGASQGDRVGLGASQTTEENLEKDNVTKADEIVSTKDVKEKEQTESCTENKASLLESEENKTCVSESRQDEKSPEEVQTVANEPPEEKGLLEGGDAEEIQVEPVKPQEEKSEKDDHEVREQVETRNPDPDNCNIKKDDGDKTEQEKPSVDKPEANREPESMETDEASTVQPKPVEPVESTDVITPASSGSHVTSDVVTPTSSGSHLTSPAGPETLPAQSVPERPPLTTEQQVKKKELMDRCIRALEYCLRRFSQHHKSRYRLAYVYYYSPEHKEVSACRDLLLGSSTRQHKTFPFPHHGVFNEKSKTNLFSAFWRIPEEDIDRPGCFCTHTYKSVALLLEVLRELNEWDTLLLIQNLLYRTPEQGKKYLRDNERHYLAKKAFEYSLEITKVRVSGQDPKVESSILSELVMDVYECWKTGQKYEASVKVTEALLTQTFEMLMATTSVSGESRDSVESPDSSSLLDQALKHCQQYVKPQASSSNTSVSQPPKGSSGTDTGTEATSGSDTEAAPTSTEQTMSVEVQQPKENTLSEKPLGKPTETPEQAQTSISTDSLSVSVHEDLKDETPMKIEDVPKVTVTPSSQEAVGLESVTTDPSTVTPDSEKAKPEEQEKPVTVTGNTGILKIVEHQATQEASRTVEVIPEAGVQPSPGDQGGLDST